MSNPGSPISTGSSSSKDSKNKDKENNNKQGSYRAVPSKHNRYKKRMARKNDKEYEKDLTLAQRQTKPTPGTNENLFLNIECKKCNLFGYYATYCPRKDENKTKDGIGLFQM